MKAQITLIENRTSKLDIVVHMVEYNFKQLELESSKIHKVVEDVDNNLRKNNLRLKRLKGGVENGSLKNYLENLLTGCLSSDTEAVVKSDFAYRLGNFGKGSRRNRDGNVLLGFPD